MPEKRLRSWDGWRSAGRLLLFLVLLYFSAAFLSGGLSDLLYVGHYGNARAASCMSNMKQLGLALAMYSQDYGALPPEAAISSRSGWREAAFPYVKSTECYHCPDDKRNSQRSDNLPKSYAANAAVLNSSTGLAAQNTILAVDTRGYDGEDWDMTSPAFLPSTGCELYTHKPSHYFYQHPVGTLNLLFADGHVKAMEPDATMTPINLWTPNNTPFVGQDLTNARAILTHAGDE